MGWYTPPPIECCAHPTLCQGPGERHCVCSCDHHDEEQEAIERDHRCDVCQGLYPSGCLLMSLADENSVGSDTYACCDCRADEDCEHKDPAAAAVDRCPANAAAAGSFNLDEMIGRIVDRGMAEMKGGR